MPELPEVETIRRGLEPSLKGARIKDVELRRANLRNAFPQGFIATLKGATVRTLRRRGKYMLADLDNGHVWLTHLGMSGSFSVFDAKKPFTAGKHDHVVVTLEGGRRIVFNDPRRFGIMDIMDASSEGDYPSLQGMGPEPLDSGFTGPALAKRLTGKSVSIKCALMDQRVVAGIGNIYASEALFLAGIDPRKPAGRLDEKQTRALAASIKAVLKAALKSGGSTLRNHRQVDGNTGNFQHHFNVYDHEGERCTNCICGGKKSIRAILQGGRTTYFCPVKQH